METKRGHLFNVELANWMRNGLYVLLRCTEFLGIVLHTRCTLNINKGTISCLALVEPQMNAHLCSTSTKDEPAH